MKVIVDTVIWSLALRRSHPDEEITNELATLIQDQRVILLGPIRQEVLSGYSESSKFNLLKEKLSFFENEPILDQDYLQAAEFHNTCRSKGIQGSHIDFLICACAHRLEAAIYTNDRDFNSFAKMLSIHLHRCGIN